MKDRTSFFKEFKEKYYEFINSISDEKPLDNGAYFYIVSLKNIDNEADKNDFISSVLPWINEHNGFDDRIEISFLYEGEELNNDSSTIPLNYDYDVIDEAMEPAEDTVDFEINVDNKTFMISSWANGTFTVYENDNYITTLTPRTEVTGVVWDSDPELDSDYAQQIGELIEEHEM